MIQFAKCPVPECDHAGTMITNNHFINAHGITKSEAISKYGKPIQVSKVATRDEKSQFLFNCDIYNDRKRIGRQMSKFYK